MVNLKLYMVQILKNDYSYLVLVLLFYSLIYLDFKISGEAYRYMYLALIYPYWRTIRSIYTKILNHPSYILKALWLCVLIWLCLFFIYATGLFLFSAMIQ